MEELTGAASWLRLAFWLYVLLSLGLLFVLVYYPKHWYTKLLGAVVALAAIAYLPVKYIVIPGKEQAAKNDEFQARRAVAAAHFNERCKEAGTRVYKTVENVEGITLLKLRPPRPAGWERDPYAAGDLLGDDIGGIGQVSVPGEIGTGDPYIFSFLLYRNSEFGGMTDHGKTAWPSYRYVDAQDPVDQKWYRYTMQLVDRNEVNPKWPLGLSDSLLRREPLKGPHARYAVTWDDISTKEGRAMWVAGGSLTIIDTATKEVIAKRVAFLFDSGLGSTVDFREPWSWARSRGYRCAPTSQELISYCNTWWFARKVLKPSQGEQ
jgi:hypothetical protein